MDGRKKLKGWREVGNRGGRTHLPCAVFPVSVLDITLATAATNCTYGSIVSSS